MLEHYKDELNFILITSTATLLVGDQRSIAVKPSLATKCERCWHYRDDVGADPAHPTICSRCTSNLFGDGERRTVA